MWKSASQEISAFWASRAIGMEGSWGHNGNEGKFELASQMSDQPTNNLDATLEVWTKFD